VRLNAGGVNEYGDVMILTTARNGSIHIRYLQYAAKLAAVRLKVIPVGDVFSELLGKNWESDSLAVVSRGGCKGGGPSFRSVTLPPISGVLCRRRPRFLVSVPHKRSVNLNGRIV